MKGVYGNSDSSNDLDQYMSRQSGKRQTAKK